jgi:hypothetical protein
MEPPPLLVRPEFESTIAANRSGPVEVARNVGLYNTIAIFFSKSETPRREGERPRSRQGPPDAQGVWVPTIVVANEVRAQLAEAGISATVASDVKAIPGLRDRSDMVLLENRTAPIRAWYDDTRPVAGYAGLFAGQPVHVAEVGIGGHDITTGQLLLDVEIKLIDASSGRVIGRARADNAWNMPTVDPLDRAFADDARRFKEVFAAEGRRLVRRCLTQLGLVK